MFAVAIRAHTLAHLPVVVVAAVGIVRLAARWDRLRPGANEDADTGRSGGSGVGPARVRPLATVLDFMFPLATASVAHIIFDTGLYPMGANHSEPTASVFYTAYCAESGTTNHKRGYITR